MPTQASSQTTHYALSQWAETDLVRREDFNADHAAIDAALHQNVQAAAAAQSAADAHAARQDNPHAVTAAQTGAYYPQSGAPVALGDGGTGQTTAPAAAAALLGGLAADTPVLADSVGFLKAADGTAHTTSLTDLGTLLAGVRIVEGTYTGNGGRTEAAAVTIDVGFVPKVIFVFQNTQTYIRAMGILFPGSYKYFLRSYVNKVTETENKVLSEDTSSLVSVSETAVTFYSSIATNGYDNVLNWSGKTYTYFAIG